MKFGSTAQVNKGIVKTSLRLAELTSHPQPASYSSSSLSVSDIRFVLSDRACPVHDGLILQCHLSQSDNRRFLYWDDILNSYEAHRSGR